MKILKLLSLVLLLSLFLPACKEKKETTLLDAVPSDMVMMVETNDMDSLIAAAKGYFPESELLQGLLEHGLYSVDSCCFVGSQSAYLCTNQASGWLMKKEGKITTDSDNGLVEEVENQLNNPIKISDNPDFMRVQSTLGSSVGTHLYLNFSLLNANDIPDFPKEFLPTLQRFVLGVKGLSAFDVLTKPDVLVLNGYTVAADSSVLRPLKYQRPISNSVVNVLPYNTRLMLHYGMSDYASYWEEFADKQTVEELNKNFKCNVEEQFVSHFSEVAFCMIGKSAIPVFVARMDNPAAVMQFMDKISSKSGVIESADVQGYTLRRLTIKDFVPNIFGNDFAPIRNCSYAIVDQYLVMANDFSALQEIISCYRSGRTLDLTDNFKTFQNNMLESANVSLYFACSAEKLFSMQFASDKDLVYSCLSLRKVSAVKEESNVQWKANLAAPLKGKPCIVSGLTSQMGNVVVFDAQNNMYFIDSDGHIIWNKEISEAPMSEIKEVDYFNDGRRQFLFNTANYLMLVDRNGEFVDGFPKRLLAEASNGLSVFDYDGTKNYRVMICGTDRFVYNYDLRAGEVEGWNRHRTDALVTKPVQHLVADNKDFIIVTDEEGTVRVLDRQGRIRIPLVSDLRKSQAADFYENKTNHKGIILTSDETGNLLYIAFDGTVARTDFGEYSANHYFLYEDFNGDNDPDFIYLDGKELQIFDRFQKVLYSHEFEAGIQTKPVFFDISRNKRLLGVVSEKAREIYLIDSKGNMIKNAGLVGETPFAVGSLHGNNEINLLTGVDNSLFNYLIR